MWVCASHSLTLFLSLPRARASLSLLTLCSLLFHLLGTIEKRHTRASWCTWNDGQSLVLISSFIIFSFNNKFNEICFDKTTEPGYWLWICTLNSHAHILLSHAPLACGPTQEEEDEEENHHHDLSLVLVIISFFLHSNVHPWLILVPVYQRTSRKAETNISCVFSSSRKGRWRGRRRRRRRRSPTDCPSKGWWACSWDT